MGLSVRQLGWVAGALGLLAGGWVPAQADTLIEHFTSAVVGSYNPRANWNAFGNGTTDRGITASGSAGNGAFHSANFADASWGVGDKEDSFRDLSTYSAIRVDARLVPNAGHSGTPQLRLGLNMADGATEWSTPTVDLTADYQTYTFEFSALTRTAGSGALDLTNCQIKLILRKNDQAGTARFDFDEVFAVSGGGETYTLTPVNLNPPPDGDSVRAIWLYAGTKFGSSEESQAVLDFCAQEGVNWIFLSGYTVWALGTEQERANMRVFVETAHASGIRVDALGGDVTWQDNPAIVQTRLNQVLAMNNATPANPNDDFDGYHFDVEFWLDSTYKNAADEAGRRQVAINYLTNVLVNARQHLDANGETDMAIGVALSSHHENSTHLPSAFSYGGTTQYFIEHVMDLVDDVVLMSYIDSASGLLSWTSYELDKAAGKGRQILVATDLQPIPPALSINTFWDNLPTAFSAMTTAVRTYHTLLSPSRAGALAGVSVFHYDYYLDVAPQPRNRADVDGDGDADAADYAEFASYLAGPTVAAEGLAVDCDLDHNGAVDLADFGRFAECYTGAGVTEPIPAGCER